MLAQVPEKLASHAHAICHYNPKGYVQRDSVSCRRETRNSPMARFTPGFDGRSGEPLARMGYMVPCKRNSDCFQRCPMHPLTGDTYRCQKQYTLYGALSPTRPHRGLGPHLAVHACVADVAETDDDGNIKMKNLTQGSGSVFDPDPQEQAITQEYGLCVDMDYSHQQGCRDATASAVMDGIVGCFDRQVSMFLCGLSLNIMDGDVSTATIEGNFFYENGGRVLVAAGQDLDGDGQSSPLLTCSDPSDCSTKCRMLERTSLHGAGAPPACALCKLCISNILDSPFAVSWWRCLHAQATSTAAATSCRRSWAWLTPSGPTSFP